jgi:hypothetical protein
MKHQEKCLCLVGRNRTGNVFRILFQMNMKGKKLLVDQVKDLALNISNYFSLLGENACKPSRRVKEQSPPFPFFFSW